MKRNIAPLLGIAFVVALAATGIFYGLFVGRLRDASAEANRQMIVVASKPVDRGHKLGPDDVKLSNWAGAFPPGAFQRVEDAVGQTVFQGLQQNEPVTLTRLSDGNMGGGVSPIAKGMRAISVRVSESTGLIPFLRAGHHIDLQMVNYRDGKPEVKTMLRNVEVLSLGGEDSHSRGPAVPIVNLLVTPAQADQLAMADSFAKVRILLRNQTENESDLVVSTSPAATNATATAKSLASSAPAAPASAKSAEENLEKFLSRIDFDVKVAGANPALVEQILSRLTNPPQDGDVQMATLKKGEVAETLLKQLESNNQLQVMGRHSVSGFEQKQLLVQAGNSWRSANGSWCGLRVQLLPTVSSNGKAVRLRVQPELTTPWNGGSTSRKVVADVDLADGQTLLLSGFAGSSELPGVLDKMFPTPQKKGDHRDVWVMITPRIRGKAGAATSDGSTANTVASKSTPSSPRVPTALAHAATR